MGQGFPRSHGDFLGSTQWKVLAVKVHSTTSARSRADRGHWGSPIPGYSWTRLGCRPAGGPGSGSMRQAGQGCEDWRPALLSHHWDRGWQPWGIGFGSRAVGRVGWPQGEEHKQAGLTAFQGHSRHNMQNPGQVPVLGAQLARPGTL